MYTFVEENESSKCMHSSILVKAIISAFNHKNKGKLLQVIHKEYTYLSAFVDWFLLARTLNL